MIEFESPQDSSPPAAVMRPLLDLIATSTSVAELAGGVCSLIQDRADVDAVGIRVRRADDFPYIESRGFAAEFVAAESRLCSVDKAGELICDSHGNPLLECMCGNVLCSRFDPKMPPFTPSGSFWTNATDGWQSRAAAIRGGGPLRGRCQSSGYQSVALIPLLVGRQIIGLLQCNDPRPGRFTAAGIAMLEETAVAAAAAIGFLDAQETLRTVYDELDQRVRDRTAMLMESSAQLKRTEQSLRRAERLASIGTLAAAIAHEINNPLGAISLYASVAMRSIDNPDRRAMLEDALSNIETQTLRCGGIVQSVLRFAREEELQRWRLDLGEIARGARDVVRKLANQRRVSVIIVPGDTPIELVANPLEMEQVFVNLITNAVQASAECGSVTVCLESDAESVRFTVEDNGHGMSKEQIDQVFDPFFSTRRKEGGIGLGLSVVYSIVDKHGGKIDVRSNMGEGTCVTVVLPRASQQSEGDGND
jgi:signal transduction histidine kinase